MGKRVQTNGGASLKKVKEISEEFNGQKERCYERKEMQLDIIKINLNPLWCSHVVSDAATFNREMLM